VERPPLDLGDLVEHWTLVGDESGLADAKHFDSRLGFALLLKFYGRFGRFPRGRGELHDDAVEFVARQLSVGAGSLGFYEWSGRTSKRHRAEIRAHFGFRECTAEDADELAGWLAAGYAQEERRYELVRDALLAELRSRSVEPPAPDRVERIVRSGLRQAEKTLVSRVSGRPARRGEGTAAGAGQRGRGRRRERGRPGAAGPGQGVGGQRQPGVDADGDLAA
jgi:hypothetical protein